MDVAPHPHRVPGRIPEPPDRAAGMGLRLLHVPPGSPTDHRRGTPAPSRITGATCMTDHSARDQTLRGSDICDERCLGARLRCHRADACGGAVSRRAPAQDGGAAAGGGQGRGAGGGRGPAAPPLVMTTTAFEDGGVIPAKFVGGMGVSPELKWTQVPMGTREFRAADARSGRRPAAQHARRDALAGLEHPGHGRPAAGRRDAGQPNCPTARARSACARPDTWVPGAPANGPYHHYTFELFALDTKLDVPAARRRKPRPRARR